MSVIVKLTGVAVGTVIERNVNHIFCSWTNNQVACTWQILLEIFPLKLVSELYTIYFNPFTGKISQAVER